MQGCPDSMIRMSGPGALLRRMISCISCRPWSAQGAKQQCCQVRAEMAPGGFQT